MEAFYALPKRTERIRVFCTLKRRDYTKLPASLSLYVAKGTPLLRYFQSSPWGRGWPALRTAPHCHGHFRGASLWVVLLHLLLQLHSSLHKPSLCKARHRVQICFLQMKTPGTASFLARGSNSKLPGAFLNPLPQVFALHQRTSVVHPGEWWPSSATQLFTGSGGRWRAGNYRGREAWEKTSTPSATPSASPLPPHCCTERCINPALG